jgi:hypothetical protein
VANRDILTVDCQEENIRTADRHSQDSKFESGLPRGYFCCGKPRYLWERFANWLFLSWQTAVFERGMPQTTEFQYLPVYIGSSPLCCVINFCRAANCLRSQMKQTEVTTSDPECPVNGIWEGVGREGGGFWLVSLFPPPLLEWHSDVLRCHLRIMATAFSNRISCKMVFCLLQKSGIHTKSASRRRFWEACC